MPMTKTDNKLSLSDREDRIQNRLLWAIRAIISGSVLWGFANGEWEAFFIGILALVLTFIPNIISSKYKIKLPIEFELIIVAFIIASVFLGEVIDAYERFWWWDAILHLASGVVLGFAGFLILYILYLNKKLITSALLIAFLSFSVAMGLGALWEIFEFVSDQNFGTNMQKNGLNDTMWDLIVDMFGALFISFIGYRTIKRGNTVGFTGRMIRRFLERNPDVAKG